MTAQVLSIQTGYSDFGNSHDHTMSAATDASKMGPPTPASPTNTDDPNRGRRRTRENEGEEGDGDMDDGEDGADPGGSSRKRRRSRKGLDKKFNCPHDGCGKSYSRAEHLYRHQLNHNPKQIYHCDFPDCHRSFVRQDLCARHKERHTARGSQLLRKDTFMHNINPIVTAALGAKGMKQSGPGQHAPSVQLPDGKYMHDSPASAHPSSATVGSSISPPMDPTMPSPASDSTMRSNSAFGRGRENEKYDMAPRSYGNYQQPQRHGSFGSMNAMRPNMSPHGSNEGFARPNLHNQNSSGSTQTYNNNSPYAGPSTSQPYNSSQHTPQYGSQTSYQSQQNIPQFNSLPPPGFSTINQSDGQNQSQNRAYSEATQSQQMEITQSTPVSDPQLLGAGGAGFALPVFGDVGYSRSPFAMADDFAAWLFNDSNFNANASPMAMQGGNIQGTMGASATHGLQAPYFSYDPVVSGYYTQPAPPQHPMAVNSILDTSLPEAALSEEKRHDLIDLIQERFNETDHAPVRKQKEGLLEGRDDPNHILSLHMMQTFIASYWSHFHPQMPILHRPTFNAAQCPNILLLAVMAMGAACLEKNHGFERTQQCAELSNFLAWHLRWEVFMDADFRPPAKLWVFQALILVELFEKMFSTRPLHERAHIHHGTTLTLMRRGSSLIGRSAMDSPPSAANPSSANGTGPSSKQTPDEWWNHWITNEATRRAAFAAFVMDSIHATMFGHSAVMVAHEMRLPLPCDETLWSAASGSEVGRIETSLHNNGVKPTTFLEGLKKTLHGQTVHTNAFGRTILMSGLLSVSWHMNQRDLQVSSLGVSQALGGRDKWRGSLTRAFDFWKTDFDLAVSKVEAGQQRNTTTSHRSALDDDLMYESRTVLHHLAHMAMHVDIVDCQIFAGAQRLLGRSITPQDYNGAQRRMKEQWAPSARARDATFYALRFLSQVLIPEDRPNAPSQNTSAKNPHLAYTARDDFLLNRPWVLYFAVLIVWSYGYALDGPLTPPYQLPTHEDCVKDMQGFLRRVGGVRAPDDLSKTQNRNACLGLLMLMREMFKKTRWELLHEASTLLNKCIDMLAGTGPS